MPTPRTLALIAARPLHVLLGVFAALFVWGFMALGDFVSGRE
jgi:hypothetical protein